MELVLKYFSYTAGIFKRKLSSLKGQCQEIFCFRFFSWINFTQASENNIRGILIFLKICGDICKSRRTTSTAGVIDTVANLQPVSMKRVKFATRYQRQRWQIIGIMSDYLLKWTWRKKKYLYVNSSTKSCPCPTKIIKNFSDWRLFPFARWCTLSCEYLRKVLKKFETALMG